MHNLKPVILVDGSSYLFRAYHALPPLTNSKGQPTGAIYGVMNMLRRLLKDYQPEQMVVVFDPKGPTFRKTLYADYKANRDVMPDELQQQIQPLFSLIRAFGFPLLIVDGVEADDVIGTLAKQAEQKKIPVLISTGDKDIAQLVNENITLINTMTNVVLDEKGVLEKFGVPPNRIIDYLSLVGDTSDNIPGVPKVGPKTAVKWLTEYGSLENIMQRADEFTGKVGEYLRESLAHLPLTKELVTLKLDVDLAFEFSQWLLMEQNSEALLMLYRELEFKSWAAEIELKKPNKTVETPAEYELILTMEQWQLWVKKLQKADIFSLDTETTGLDAMQVELVGLSFSVGLKEAAYLPLMHDYLGAPLQLTRAEVFPALSALLQDTSKTIVGQNLKYDLTILWNAGLTVNAALQDTLLESYVLNNVTTRHDMDTLAKKYLDIKTISFEEVAGKGTKQLTFNQIALEEATPYAAEDADVTLQLHQVFQSEFLERPECLQVYETIELPLMPILTKMEYTGILVDAKMLQAQSIELQKKLGELQAEIFELAGESFNIDSPKQLQEILFQRLKIPIVKKTPTGQPSTAEDVLQELSENHAIAQYILNYRSLAKLKSTYTDKLPKQINPKTGRVHTHYNQAGTSTGRLSSSDPNLQNIPIRTLEGRRIREAFIAPPGYCIVSADYSQAELRIMAHFSQDPGLLKAFSEEKDVHISTAAEVFGVPIENVTAEQRRNAKAINFGLMYGMSAFGLAQQLGVSRKEAEEHIEVYFSRYPNVKGFMEKSRELATQQGYVQTISGRRLYMPEIHSKNILQKRAAERAAINAPLQGSVSDIIKLAMIKVQQWIDQTNADVKMLLQVHDELIFEVREETLESAKQAIKQCMETAVNLSVPLLVDVGVGKNWDEAH